jgi:hypothetical protein
MLKWFWVESDTPRMSYLESKAQILKGKVCVVEHSFIHSHCGADQYTGKKIQIRKMIIRSVIVCNYNLI